MSTANGQQPHAHDAVAMNGGWVGPTWTVVVFGTVLTTLLFVATLSIWPDEPTPRLIASVATTLISGCSAAVVGARHPRQQVRRHATGVAVASAAVLVLAFIG